MKWKIPVKTENMLKESKHKPSMQYAQDIYNSIDMNKFTALEIGGAWGLSTLAILEAGAKHLTTVDNNVNAQAANEAKVNGYDNHVWTLCRSDKFWRDNKNLFDLIYIDGSHVYEDVKNDLYEGWKRVKPNGTLMADDWDHKHNILVKDGKLEYGVSLACWEFWRDHIDEITGVIVTGRVLQFNK